MARRPRLRNENSGPVVPGSKKPGAGGGNTYPRVRLGRLERPPDVPRPLPGELLTRGATGGPRRSWVALTRKKSNFINRLLWNERVPAGTLGSRFFILPSRTVRFQGLQPRPPMLSSSNLYVVRGEKNFILRKSYRSPLGTSVCTHQGPPVVGAPTSPRLAPALP